MPGLITLPRDTEFETTGIPTRNQLRWLLRTVLILHRARRARRARRGRSGGGRENQVGEVVHREE
jgi:hypothetical protein